MIAYDRGDIRRINHFLKVFAFVSAIGELEGLGAPQMEILRIAALVHDIGIHESERKYHSCDGRYQQVEGPPIAADMLAELGYSPDIIERVCWLVAHHHEYGCITDLDHRILAEADFLVNADEENMSDEAVRSVRDKIFRTETGKQMLGRMYAL